MIDWKNFKIWAIMSIVLIIICATVSGLLINNIKTKEIIALEDASYTLQNELNEVKSNLSNEVEKSTNLNKELELVNIDLAEANEMIDILRSEYHDAGVVINSAEIDMIAKTVYGEARGLSTFEQSMVVWCILNRVDNGYWGRTVAEVVTAPNQFHGYSSSFPVTDDIKALVIDVVARWQMEKYCSGSVGRTLPERFLYFHAENRHNIFTTNWTGSSERYNWNNCYNPYS